MPILYLSGWIISLICNLLIFDFNKGELSLFGTFLTFILFLYILPSWGKIRWGIDKVWIEIGILNLFLKEKVLNAITGYFQSYLFILIVLSQIYFGDWVLSSNSFSLNLLKESLFLGFVVAIPEEIIFRGWLLREIKLFIKGKYSVFLQALIFSLAHMRFYMNFMDLFSMFFGLFLLGIVLALRTSLDKGSLWGAISLHGGLVSSWYLITQIFNFSDNIPQTLIGPGGQNPNPIGSFTGILILSVVIIYQRKTLDKF